MNARALRPPLDGRRRALSHPNAALARTAGGRGGREQDPDLPEVAMPARKRRLRRRRDWTRPLGGTYNPLVVWAAGSMETNKTIDPGRIVPEALKGPRDERAQVRARCAAERPGRELATPHAIAGRRCGGPGVAWVGSGWVVPVDAWAPVYPALLIALQVAD
ncbi:MAG: hypothetical protein ACYTG0_47475 [Planctomycetota bacterium]